MSRRLGRALSGIGRFAIAALLYLIGRRRQARPRRGRVSDQPPPVPGPHERELPSSGRAETIVALLLLACGLCGGAFVAFYFIDDDTQLLGLSLGLGFAFLAAALIVAAKRVIPQETSTEEREDFGDEEVQEEIESLVHEGGEGLNRRKLLLAAGGAAATGLGAAVVWPVASLGPNVGNLIRDTPWHDGRYVVDEHDRRVKVDDIEVGSFMLAFPEGADKEEVGSPVNLVRLRADELDLPRDRRGWDAEGILAYSRICTHAGCAVTLFRYPAYERTSSAPALVCPCHYSTFDPRRACKVVFGPAGRPLPQLPLRIDAERHLVAAGRYSGPPGPSYPRVRLQR